MKRSMSRSNARRSAARRELARRASRDQMAWNVPSVSMHAEQVVEAVVERERVALDVEEQVARRRRRQRREAAVGLERPSPARAASSSYERSARVVPPAGAAPARGPARARPRCVPSSGGRIGSGEVAERLERRDAALGERLPLARA